ncbi:glycosyltransferase family 2 protein [Planktothricoides raciborskii]|uniref:Glycosyltransferase family 2 protein n=1 Tax=Planktothricoides raciborskii GIHE-MW2 TaxID=2792601 RepID=A0AAU8JJS0_9CYAN
MKYSVVIPIFNEQETISELWKRLLGVFQAIKDDWEIIFVNDGSTDASRSMLTQLSQQHQNVKFLSLSRNFGHQPAITAGIDYAQGDAVILMDGDLQDDPDAILTFIDLWKQGYDVVYAHRKKRKEPWLKRLAFKTFYYLQTTLSDINLPRDAGIFSLLDRRVIQALRQMPERNKYLSGLRAYTGFHQIGVVVERGPRYHGQPRVSIRKLFKLAFDGIFSFSTLPLRFVTYLGILISLTALAIAMIGLVVKFILGLQFFDWPFGLTSIFFLGGVQLLSLGIIGEYIGRIYEEVKQRPYYIVAEAIGFELYKTVEATPPDDQNEKKYHLTQSSTELPSSPQGKIPHIDEIY